VGHRVALDILEKRKVFCTCQDSNPDRPSCSLSHYSHNAVIAHCVKMSSSEMMAFLLNSVACIFLNYERFLYSSEISKTDHFVCSIC
jgi:alpha/beta superfamily hydrolase